MKRSPAIPTALILVLAAAATAFPEPDSATRADWTQFRGPGGSGARDDSNPPITWTADENIVWKRELPGPGTSSPIVIGKRIFLTCFTGLKGSSDKDSEATKGLRRHVLCLERDTGKILWTKEVETKFPVEDRIREDHGFASSTPAADPERVYVFFGKSGVFAFDHEGKQIWRQDVGSELNGWGSAASPVLHGGLVIVNASVESQSLVALDKLSGKEKWRAPGIRDAWNTPLVVELPGGKSEIVVPILKKVLAFDPANGERLWSCDTEINWYICPSAVAHDGVVYSIGGRSGGGIAVRAGGKGDVTGSRLVWSLKKGSNVSSPVYHDGHVYFAHENLGIAYCVNAKTGEIVYEERLQPEPGQIYASPVLAGKRLYYVSRGGRTVVLAATPKFEQLAHNAALDRSTHNATPAISGDRLLLRSDKFLYCIGKSGNPTSGGR